jgi:2-phospho-L-lactate guanylyltransferase
MSNTDRLKLAHRMLQHVLCVLSQVPDITLSAIVSPEAVPGATVIADHGVGLNVALGIGAKWAMDCGADAMLVLPADLPLLTTSDIDDIISLIPDATGGVVAPSKDGGTGALALRPPHLIQPAFGVGSAARHLELIRAVGGSARELHRPGLALDVDEPEDLSLLDPTDQTCNVGRGPR